MKTIPYFCFGGCESLKEIVIPESLTSIGWDAFRHCDALTDVVFPKSLQKIDFGAFEECKSLKTVTFSTGLKTIHESAFESRFDEKGTQLQAIYVPAKKTDYYKQRLPEKLHSLIVELEPVKKAKKQ